MTLDRAQFALLCKELFDEESWHCHEWEDHAGHRLYVHLHGELDLLALHRFMGRLQDFQNVVRVTRDMWESGTSADLVSGDRLNVWIRD